MFKKLILQNRFKPIMATVYSSKKVCVVSHLAASCSTSAPSPPPAQLLSLPLELLTQVCWTGSRGAVTVLCRAGLLLAGLARPAGRPHHLLPPEAGGGAHRRLDTPQTGHM